MLFYPKNKVSKTLDFPTTVRQTLRFEEITEALSIVQEVIDLQEVMFRRIYQGMRREL